MEMDTAVSKCVFSYFRFKFH